VSADVGVKRLNWGCGASGVPGWVNSDRKEGPGIDVSADIGDGLPFESESFDYAVAIHALPEVPYDDLVPVLEELRRILKRGGVLRVALPDLEKGVAAYQRGDRDYFLVPDEDWDDLGSKLIVQLVWYGYSRMLFVAGFVEELLRKSGFEQVRHLAYRQTASNFPEIVELDNRERESLFVEATKP
jgi:SAM-dependent methyltransferase